VRRLAIAVLAVLTLVGLAAWPLALHSAAATRPAPKVVVIAGPVGDHNAHYQADADAIAKTARKYTSNVVLIKSPRATWDRVKAAIQNASIVVYLGHGNGWPSIYPPYQPYTKDGFGLDPDTGADGDKHVYIGEYTIGREVQLAPNAVVLFHHLCYASGNTEPGLAVGPLSDSKQRPDNYAAGFVQAGARAVIADVAHPHTAYIDWLFTKHMTIRDLFYRYPTYHGHPILTDSVRQPGFKQILDPTYASSQFYRSIVYDPSLTTDEVTRTWYRATDTAPAALAAPGAAETTADSPFFADAALAGDGSVAVAGTLPAGTKVRVTSMPPALADGTRVVGFTTFDAATSGFADATAFAPRDSSAPKLWTIDAPYSPASADGTWPFAIGYRASEAVAARIDITDAAGTVVRHTLLHGDWRRWTWDLVGDGGSRVANGTYTWRLTATDDWGNAPAVAKGTVTIDGTDPVSTTSISAGTLGGDELYITPATVKVGATDSGSGVTAKKASVDGGPFKVIASTITLSTSGTHTVRYASVDRAGNVETARTRTVKVDVTRPVTGAVATGTTGTNGWFTGPVSVALTPTDAHSGVAGLTVSVDGAPAIPYTTPIALTTEGIHTLAYGARDRAGNRETTKTTTIRIDGTDPGSTGATLSGAVGAEGWFIGAVTVTFAGGTDAVSGLRGYRYWVDGGSPAITTSKATIATSGEHVVTWGAQDVAGNVETTRSISFKVDVDPPRTTITLAGDRGEPGFYRGPVSIALAATDAHSGVERIVAAIDGAPSAPVSDPLELTASGIHKVIVRAYDRAGNAEAARTLSIVIDRTAPTLTAAATTPTFSPNADGATDAGRFNVDLSEPGTVRATVKDRDGAVVRSYEADVADVASLGWDGRDSDGDIVPDGTYTVSLVPIDRAGNAGSAVSVTLRVYGAFVGGVADPARFFPQDGDAVAKSTVFRATLRSDASVRVQVLTTSGKVIRTITKDVSAGAFAIGWDGRTDAGSYAAQGRYTLRVTATTGSLSETKRFTVVASAFDIRTSVTTARRGHAITVTIVSAEALGTFPRLVVRQPGISPYAVTLTRVGPGRLKATFTVRRSSSGTMSLTVTARDRAGHAQSTKVTLPVR
jgi:flagellar hook assembly protein FlgD